MTEIIKENDSKFMESNVTYTVKHVIKELCHRLYKKNGKEVNYIEIGIWYGGTFKEILKDCVDIKIQGIGIDFFEDFEILNEGKLNTHVDPVITLESCQAAYEKEGLKNFTLIKGDSVKSLNSLQKMDNVVCFIDGNHTYEAVKGDFTAAVEKINNGYIVLDDCWAHEHKDGTYGIYKFFLEIKDKYRVLFRDDRNVVFKIGE